MDHSHAEVKKRARKVAQLFVDKGMKAGEAMRQAGYSEQQCRKGVHVMLQRKEIRTAVEKRIAKLKLKMASLPGPEERAFLARERLVKNVLSGQDKSVASIKLIGQDKEVSMWQPENQGNQILVNLSSLGDNFGEK